MVFPGEGSRRGAERGQMAVPRTLPDPRTVLPSTAIEALNAPATSATRRRNTLLTCFGPWSRKMCENVSLDAMPFFNTRTRRRRASLLRVQKTRVDATSCGLASAWPMPTSADEHRCRPESSSPRHSERVSPGAFPRRRQSPSLPSSGGNASAHLPGPLRTLRRLRQRHARGFFARGMKHGFSP